MKETFTKEDFFQDFEIVKMNNKSLTVFEKRTQEYVFVSRNAFNTIMTNKAKAWFIENITMPNGNMIKWLGVVTTIVF